MSIQRVEDLLGSVLLSRIPVKKCRASRVGSYQHDKGVWAGILDQADANYEKMRNLCVCM